LITRRELLVGVTIVAGVGCLKPVAPPVRVGRVLWPPYEMFELAWSLGYYRSAEIQLIDFGSLAEGQRAYEANVIDALATTAEYPLQLAERSREHRIVLLIDFSNGGDTLVARRGVARLADLKGMRVGFEASGLGVYMLTRALERAGMSMRDVILVPVDLIDHEAAFVSGRIDAVVTYEPVRTKVISKGGQEIFSSRDIPHEIVDVLVVRSNLLATRGPVLQRLVDGWFHAIAYFARNPLDAARRVASREDVSPEEYLLALHGAELPSLEENRRLLAPASPLVVPLRRLAELAAQEGILKQPVDPAPLLDDRLVRAVRP
jgi:NitT/TauT family transport system substrate-binding protein